MRGKKRLLSFVLALVMMASLLPLQTLAIMLEKNSRITIVDKDGKAISEGADWETVFPYGTFAFETSQLDVTEGEGEQVIRLYRMGGTAGRAVAYLTYVPVAANMADGTKSYANAAGANDVVIQVEDPLPIAQYQRLGKDAEPLEAKNPAAVQTGEYTGEESESGDVSLSLDQEADAYQWQILAYQVWEDVDGAAERQFNVSEEDYESFDFRCIYTVDGQQYGSVSAKGEGYVSLAEQVPEMPDDLELNPSATYTQLGLDPKEPYQGYAFSVTFAEGEWVKEIRIFAPEDEDAEADKFGLVTIVDCLGGSLYDAANTLTLHVYDNDAPEASELGFVLADMEADKAAGSAKLTVRRTGGNQTVLTIDYETRDGAAVAGQDYIAASGTLTFYADADEQTIEVPLIDDGVVTQERKDFTVELSNLKGDKDGLCTLVNTEATVRLWNSGEAESANLATLLRDGEALDVSGDVIEAEGSVAPVSAGTLTGTQLQEETPALVATLEPTEEGDLGLLTYDYGASEMVKFTRGSLSNYNNSYWRDYRFIAQANNEYSSYDANGLGANPLGGWSGGDPYGDYSGRVYYNKSAGSISAIVNDAFFEEHFSGGIFKFDFRPEWASSWTITWRGVEYTYPWFKLWKNGTAEYIDSGQYHTGSWAKGYTLYWGSPKSASYQWEMNQDVSKIELGTSRYDAHNSDAAASSILSTALLQRRSLTRDLGLRVYTANDSDTAGGAALLEETSGVYQSIKPRVEIVTQGGGVTNSGKLYTGSRLRITLSSTDSYFLSDARGTGAQAPVFLTSGGNSVVKEATYGGKNTDGSTYYFLALEWNDMSLTDQYTINVIMSRKQNFDLNITPSVPRIGNSSSVDMSKMNEAWTNFWGSKAESLGASDNYISYGYSSKSASRPYLNSNTIYSGTVTAADLVDANTVTDVAKRTKNLLENVQWVNFNRSSEDRILYNGRIYAGDATIWLEMGDFSLSSMTFRYYHKDYLSATSVMSTSILRTGLYLDKNANGRIDGYWNEQTQYFVLDENADEFLFYLGEGVDYDEAVFAPVPIAWDSGGNPTKYAQYFLKVTYTMTPRALVPAVGTSTDGVAQVLPIFTSNITDPATKNSLTEEQRAYRYMISGKNRSYTNNQVTQNESDYVRSADNHPMYGAEAGKVSSVDIPLGGDISPATINAAGTDYTWEPNYQGNLLYPYAAPEPIFIPNTLVGDNFPIAEIADLGTDGKVSYADGAVGVKQVNGYLGSFTANTAFGLCVQEQTQTTDEIAAANGVDVQNGSLALLAGPAEPPKPESSDIGLSGSFPNSEYLKSQKAAAEDEGGVDMEDSGNQYDEFNLDLGVQLPSTNISATDFLTIIMDEYQVGFSIGLPLGGYDSKKEGAGGKQGAWSSPADSMKSSKEDMGKLLDFMKKRDMNSFKETDDSYKDALNDKKMSSGGFKVNFSIALAFLFKYNSVDNAYYFNQFSVSVTAKFEYKYQYRLTPCPIVYLYVTVGIGAELGTGVTVERVTVENTSPVLAANTKVTKGQSYKFSTDLKAFNMTFDGKVLVELFENEACNIPADSNKFSKGFLKSSGTDPVTITLFKQGGQSTDKTYWVRLTALEDTTISRIVTITKMETKNYWSGFNFAPEAFIEAGAGIGVEIMKFEVFVKVNISCAMTLGAYNEALNNGEGGYDAFSFDKFEFGLGLGFRVVLLIFSYEMDLIKYTINYEKGKGWTQSWSALGGLFGETSSLSATDAQGNTYGVRIRLPGDTSQTQTIYPGDTEGGDLSPLAYDAGDKLVPFQLSGYGSSGDAFKLADGLITGYDYQVVTANEENYLVYTISRTGAAHPVDNSMLVLSRIRLTSAGGADSYGLVNPLDEDDATPYIVLDDDDAGDLGFTVWADDSDVIHAAWVSYATQANVTPVGAEPTEAKPGSGSIEMDEDNYENPAFEPGAAPTAPVEPVLPGAEPVQADYWITAAAYADLDPGEQTDYTLDGTDYHHKDYASLTAAQGAYTTDKGAYDAAVDEYDQYLEDKDLYDTVTKPAYDAKKSAYDAWYAYFLGLNDYNAQVQLILSGAAKNTEIKTASFDAKQTVDGFSAAQVASAGSGAHVFLPNVADGDVSVYAKAEHYDAVGLTTAANDYQAYLKNIGYDINGADDAQKSIGAYRLLYQKGLWDAYGKGSLLCVSVNGTVTELAMTEGQTLDNLEAAKIGDSYYLTYTTSEQQYMDGSSTAATAEDADDMVTIRRLFLRSFTVSGSTVTWSNEAGGTAKALLLRTLYDFDVDSKKDGLYNGGAMTAEGAYSDPYFANLQFLRGKLGDLTGAAEDFTLMSDAKIEDFLLFEMNGSTYVIPQDDLEGIIGSSHNGRIIPFFAPTQAEVQDGKKSATTGRAEVTIGVDGAGNISAVYVGTVSNTTNNAVYLAKYDSENQEWGEGTMLAMNYMQVYEDAITQGLSAAETEQAFYGMLSGYDKGGMDQFKFANLQIALGQTAADTSGLGTLSQGGEEEARSSYAAPDTALLKTPVALLGGTVTDDGPSEIPDGTPAVEPLGATGDGNKDTLLVITQGTMQYLTERSYTVGGEPETMISPMSDADAQSTHAKYVADSDPRENRRPGVGVYALSFGAGRQAIGESRLTFAEYDFSAGSKLRAGLSFINTGDVSIRGSGAQPITVALMVKDSTGSAPIASWIIEENIPAGRKVALSGECAALTDNLPIGSVFYIEVSEDAGYAATCWSGNTLVYHEQDGTWTGNLTVEEKPDLGFESSSITTVGVDENGNAILDVSFQVGNRGSGQAEDVFIQFSYDTGVDSGNNDGTTIYAPLNITGNTLKVSTQQALQALAVSGNDFSNGIFYLYNAEDGDDMDVNYARTVEGRLFVPPSCYQGSLTESLNLRVEVFGAGDDTSAWSGGLITAEHNEYYGTNNTVDVQLEHKTFMRGTSKVTVPMGNTMRIPLYVSTTTGKAPNIVVEQKAGDHLGILYYEAGSFAGGRELGTLVLAPGSEGNGVIHVEDVNTNTIFAITYEVTGEQEGINIFNDTDVFTFYNKNGSRYDATQAAGTQNWRFAEGVEQWGSGTVPPYRSDLSQAEVGTKFTFRTQAESIRLYFDGTVEVTSTFPGFSGATVTGSGSEPYAVIKFGDNQTNYTHTVTVTVTKAAGVSGTYASFDRVIETFGGAETPKPAPDAASPHIYWSRSFPETASLPLVEKVTLKGYVLDDTGLASLTLNGQRMEKLTEVEKNFWTFTIDVTANGSMEVVATDTAGKSTTQKFMVDLFNIVQTPGASAAVPELSAEIGETPPYSIAVVAKDSTGDADEVVVTAKFIQATADGLVEGQLEDISGSFPVGNNGWYLVTATDPAAVGSGWSAVMLYMEEIDDELPVVTLGKADTSAAGEGERALALSWSARKEFTGTTKHTIKSANINGADLGVQSGQSWAAGSWPVTHGGDYLLTALDSSGNSNQAAYHLTNVPVAVMSGSALYTVDNDWLGDGKLTLNPSTLIGGLYDGVQSTPASNLYQGSYEWRLLTHAQTEGKTLADILAEDGWSSVQTVFTDLAHGAYALYIRDVQEPSNEDTVLVKSFVVGDESIVLTLEEVTDEEEALYGTRILSWSADKGAGALEPIAAVAINGQAMDGTQDFSRAGTLEIQYGGNYLLKAQDADGENRALKTLDITIEDFPLTVQNGAELLKVHNAWNGDLDNGILNINLFSEQSGEGGIVTYKNLTGGTFDPLASDPENGLYFGQYEWRLEPEVDFGFDNRAALEALKEEWLGQPENSGITEVPEQVLSKMIAQVARDLREAQQPWLMEQLDKIDGWVTESSIENIAVGGYILVIRDTQEPANETTPLILPVIVNSEFIEFDTTVTRASSGSAFNGAINVEAFHGYLLRGTYQFIARPIGEAAALIDLADLTEELDPEKYPAQSGWITPDWQLSDIASKSLNTAVLGGLKSGWYQVAVRPMLDVNAGEMEDLAVLYDTYVKAMARAEAAEQAVGDRNIVAAIRAQTNALSQALDTWRKAKEEDLPAAEQAYKLIIQSDGTVLAALEEWKDAGYRNGEAKTAYEEAVSAYFTNRISSETSTEKANADDALLLATQDYETERARLEAKSDAAYQAAPELWRNGATKAVFVPVRSATGFTDGALAPEGEIQVSDLDYSKQGEVKITFTEEKPGLSEAVKQKLIADNAELDIIAIGPGMKATIPAGTLTAGDNITDMLMPFVNIPADVGGYVVQYTDADGNTHYVPWSLVTVGKVYYIATQTGEYKLVKNTRQFADVTEDFWGAQAILFVVARGLFQGVDEDSFAPNGEMTRGMFVTVLGRLAGITPGDYSRQTFADVDSGSWYGPYVAWASENGIVLGLGENSFGPDVPVTREQICTMLVRYLEKMQIGLSQYALVDTFTDEEEISPWALSAVKLFQGSGIVEGTETGAVRPGAVASRAEVAAIYARLISLILTQ